MQQYKVKRLLFAKLDGQGGAADHTNRLLHIFSSELA